MKYTENYNLRLPEGDNVINSSDLDINYNAKEIDRILADDDDAIAAITTTLATKVDKADGMGLSSNDFTDAEKTKLAGVAEGATVGTNVIVAASMPSDAANGTICFVTV